MTIRYFAVLFDDEASVEAPDAIFRSVDGGVRLDHLDRSSGEWVDNPELAGYFRGEPGAEPITEEQARRTVEKWGIGEAVIDERPLVSA